MERDWARAPREMKTSYAGTCCTKGVKEQLDRRSHNIDRWRTAVTPQSSLYAGPNRCKRMLRR